MAALTGFSSSRDARAQAQRADPMRRRPPMAALEAFEAAARLGSFLAASAELHVTQSAISHRIKLLESVLGVPLFVRINRHIALTPHGEHYLAAVRTALENLEHAAQALPSARRGARPTIRICAMPAIGSRWLVGQLAAFQEAVLDADLQVATPYQAEKLKAGAFDLGIRFGAEKTPGLASRELLKENLVAVASHALKRRDRLNAPADMARVTRFTHPLLPWGAWFAAAGLVEPPARGATFDDATLMYEAVNAGQGVALMPDTLLRAYPALRKIGAVAVLGRAYYVVTPVGLRASAQSEAAEKLAHWLLRAGT
jgi:LysR family transcriptional regulator, glycine cleavage system transcriptional activator